MSLTTRCPVCATTFKVVPDQLRISDGWVRCGRCGEVFDAPVTLGEASDPDSAPVVEVDDELKSESPDPSSVPTKALPHASGGTVIDAQWWQSQPSLDMPTAVVLPDAAPAMGVVDESPINKAAKPDADLVSTMKPMAFRATTDENVPVPDGTPPPAFLPGFLSTKGKKPLPRPKVGSRLIVLLAIVAMAALLLQVAFQQRDFLAARQPRLKPFLLSLCRFTGCEVSAPRQIASIRIDGASFSREPVGDGYRLYFNLRNMAAMKLKMPAIELTLLDTQERPVLRRVLQPADFGAPSEFLPQAEQSAALRLVLTGPEAASLPPLAGYHVDPFYP